MSFRFSLPAPRVGRRSAFSLVEVVLAVGIFAVAVLAVLGLLLPNTKLVRDQVDSGVAQRLSQNIQLELERYGFDSVTAGLTSALQRIYLVATRDGSRVLITGEDPFAAWNDTYNNYDPESSGNYGSVASPLAAENDLDGNTEPKGIAFRDRFFLIEVSTPIHPEPPFTNPDNPGVFPLSLRVIWPYRLPNGPANPGATSSYKDYADLPWLVARPSEHSTMLFNAVLTP